MHRHVHALATPRAPREPAVWSGYLSPSCAAPRGAERLPRRLNRLFEKQDDPLTRETDMSATQRGTNGGRRLGFEARLGWQPSKATHIGPHSIHDRPQSTSFQRRRGRPNCKHPGFGGVDKTRRTQRKTAVNAPVAQAYAGEYCGTNRHNPEIRSVMLRAGRAQGSKYAAT